MPIARPQKKSGITALDVGRYFIWRGNLSDSAITNKKLQKLVYYAQAWCLALTDKPLFSEDIEAWVHGPAVRSLYGKYKGFGFGPIVEDVNENHLGGFDTQARRILDEVWRVYGMHDAGYLEMLTHSEVPWQEARKGLPSGENSSNAIKPQVMNQYYKQKLQDAQKK